MFAMFSQRQMQGGAETGHTLLLYEWDMVQVDQTDGVDQVIKT